MVTLNEPTERFYGTDCGLRDHFDNALRIGAPDDYEVPKPSEVASSDWS